MIVALPNSKTCRRRSDAGGRGDCYRAQRAWGADEGIVGS